MRKKLLILVGLVAVASSVLFGAANLNIRWMDDEARAWRSNKWREHCKTYGAFSNNVIFPYGIDTNWCIAALADGTKIELGFRDDGLVVWRKK